MVCQHFRLHRSSGVSSLVVPHTAKASNPAGVSSSPLPVVQIPRVLPGISVFHLVSQILRATAMLEADVSGHSVSCGLMLGVSWYVRRI